MKALSVMQPWAQLIRDGRKPIETRTWTTAYRGPLLICSSARLTPDARAACAEHGCDPAALPLGRAVCLAELRDVRPYTEADVPRGFAPFLGDETRFAWVLDHIRPVPPFHVRGGLRLFDVPDSLIGGPTDSGTLRACDVERS